MRYKKQSKKNYMLTYHVVSVVMRPIYEQAIVWY